MLVASRRCAMSGANRRITSYPSSWSVENFPRRQRPSSASARVVLSARASKCHWCGGSSHDHPSTSFSPIGRNRHGAAARRVDLDRDRALPDDPEPVGRFPLPADELAGVEPHVGRAAGHQRQMVRLHSLEYRQLRQDRLERFCRAHGSSLTCIPARAPARHRPVRNVCQPGQSVRGLPAFRPPPPPPR